MNLKDEIKKLVTLQDIDLKIYNFQQKKDVEIPAQLDKIKNELDKDKQALENYSKALQELQVAKKNKDLDLASKEETLKKFQCQLYQLKTNKEYQAKLLEIATAKTDISLLEEEVLKFLDNIETAQQKLNDQKEKFAQKENENKGKRNVLFNEAKEIEINIKTLQDKRIVFIREINKQILSKYEELLKPRAGLAIVPVNTQTCGACFINVTHQTINEIKMYSHLILCSSCVRILYIPEDIE